MMPVTNLESFLENALTSRELSKDCNTKRGTVDRLLLEESDVLV